MSPVIANLRVRVGASLLLIFGALFGGTTASAQNAVVDLNVTLSPITILYYFSTVNVTVPSSAMAGLLCGTGVASATYGAGNDTANCNMGATGALAATGSGAGLTANGAIGSPGGFNAAAVPLTLQNVWAVRAVGGTTASTTVSISLGTSTSLLSPAGVGPSSIVLSAPLVSTSTASAGNNTAAVTFPDPGLVNAQQGNVALTLNMTNALVSGLYSSGAAVTGDSNYILTVSGT
jgi:hypothetical protein